MISPMFKHIFKHMFRDDDQPNDSKMIWPQELKQAKLAAEREALEMKVL